MLCMLQIFFLWLKFLNNSSKSIRGKQSKHTDFPEELTHMLQEKANIYIANQF